VFQLTIELMMQLPKEVLDQTMALPRDQRAALAHQLLQSLEPPDFDDDEATWEKEFASRLDAVEEGNYSARDWREALAEMRQTLQKERQK
jgi:putative addiction module component (TIGR02574 family)